MKLAELKVMAQILGIVQILSLTFLCLITPYILQTWMATRIYIGGRPGQNLIMPLYASGILSIAGMFLAKTGNPNFWALNRLGTVVTGPPVLKTLKMYNSLTTVGGQHAGRGNILCQTLYVTEVWCMIAQILCAVGYAFQDPTKPKNEYTALDCVLAGFRDIAFVSGWTRVLIHSIFVNLLDELSMTQAPGSTAESNDRPFNNDGDEEGVFENTQDGEAMVSLVSQNKSSFVQRG